jgi:hypothetical protein
MTAEDDIAAYLATGGFGTVGTSIFLNTMPPTPDACIAVSVYAGGPPERTYDGSGNDNPSVQVRVRDSNAGTARTKVEQIYNYLDGRSNTTINSTFYLGIFAINSGAIPMGKDENGRTEYTWNFSVKRSRR